MDNRNENVKRPQAGAAAPMKTWIRAVLFVSLALNFMVIGLVGTTFVTGGGRIAPPPHARLLGPVTKALLPEDRRSLGLVLRQEHRRNNAGGRAEHRGLGDFISALRTEPFDAKAVTRSLKERQRIAGKQVEYAREQLVTRLGAMNAKERAAYVSRLVAELDKRPPRARRPKRD